MKRIVVLILALCLALAGATAQTFDGFQTAFTSFADSMAGSLNINATVGDTWSTAYIGGFPHLGAGLAVGATFVDKSTTEDLFASLGQSVPSGLDKVGLPVPAAAATFKIGLPFLPLDVGLKAGVIPASVGSSLSSLYGVEADYKNVGLSLRYALLKEKLLVPAVSLGLSGNYLAGSVKKSLGSSQTMTYNSSHSYTATMSEPMLDMAWESMNLDLTAQVSKKIIFFTPYAGAGLTIGKSTVKGGIDSTLSVSEDGGPTSQAAMDDLAADLAAAGYDVDLDGNGFRYITTNTTPTVRLYGGFSLDILVVLDCQVMYVPATKNLGASLNARIQL